MKKYYLIQGFEGSFLSGKSDEGIPLWSRNEWQVEFFETEQEALDRIPELGTKSFYRIVPAYVND